MEEVRTIILLLITTGVIFGIFCAWLAAQKNYGTGAWFFLGFFFWIIALIALAGAPVRDQAMKSLKEE